MLPRITGEFTVGTDPVLKYAQTGTAIASFSAVASKSKKNDATGEWENDKEIWVRVTAFKQLAEHVAESVVKGSRVVISGQVNVSEWEDKEGNKRTSVEVIADDLGVSLRFGTATYTKAARSETATPAAAENPWTTNQQSASAPPF